MESLALQDVSADLTPKIISSRNGQHLPSCATPPRISVSWKNLSYSVPTSKGKKKNLLNDLSGNLRSGELTAILGPSGAGKTTLLNILSGFQTRGCQGQLFVNGQATKEKSFRKLSSYIMNGDNLIQHLTVRETIDAAARLKMPENSTYQQRDALVTNLLKSWDLDGCEHRAIRHLSSGQRKRVTVAQELVNTPPVIFLDEPTSGLDSSSSLQCIMLLRELATRGLTIAFSIHQPSSRLFQLFDRLYVLAEGSCIYRGPAKDMVLHLNSNNLQCPPFYNPADFLIEVASGDYGSVKDSLVEYTNINMDKVPCYASAMTNGYIEDTQHDEVAVVPLLTREDRVFVNTVSLGLQIKVLLKRCYLSLVRNPMVFHLRLATHVAVGVIMGLLYYGTGNRADLLFNNATLVFFALMFLTFTGMMPVVLVFPLEASVFTRERCNSWYTLKAYYLAKTIVEIPFQILHPTLFISIVYWMTSQPSDCYRYVMFTATCVLVSFVAHSLGMLIGAIACVQVAVFLAPAVAIPFMLFSGFVVTLRAIPHYLRWFSYASFLRYAYESSMRTLYGYDRPELECLEDDASSPCLFVEPNLFLDFMGLHEMSVEVCLAALLGFVVVLQGATYLALRHRGKRAL
ncbi:ATP-binding cassette sub-family G member 1 [Ixodes scapularis]|uniref:ATP-binding cassette sub-family G member 1 n=1 Tax=Ixodes scapularis TaxID=6945 RepID=UPI001A9D3C7C|nr:ATP-binding cassette sub-family G member 1 [Ixodes scapularis]